MNKTYIKECKEDIFFTNKELDNKSVFLSRVLSIMERLETEEQIIRLLTEAIIVSEKERIAVQEECNKKNSVLYFNDHRKE